MKIFPFLSPMTGIGTAVVVGLVSQQTGINISTELLISILVNVAVLALAFGKVQSNVGHIRELITDMKKEMEKNEEESKERDKEIKARVEHVATRTHKLANIAQKYIEQKDNE